MPFVIIVAFFVAMYLLAVFLIFKLGICKDDTSQIDLKPGRITVKKNIPDEQKEIIKMGREEFDKAEFEVLETTSFDKLKLKALFYKVENPKGTILLFHGYKSSPRHDFGTLFPMLKNLGYNLVFPHQRSQGVSEGKYVTLGVNERKDALKWVKFINKTLGYQQNIFVMGISMGATTVDAAAKFGYPDNVRGIISDCGFTTPKEIVYKVGTDIWNFKPVLNALINGLESKCTHTAHFDMKDLDVVKSLEKTNLPILFIHGKADKFVPFSMTEKMYEKYKGEKEFLQVENAEHALSYAFAREEYTNKLTEFIKKYEIDMPTIAERTENVN